MARRGREIEKAYELRLLEEKLEQELTVSCAHCKRTKTGLLRDVRGWHEAHRLKYHPEVRPAKRKRHRTSFGQIVTEKSLDENVGAVRLQGGHRFDTDMEAA